MPVDEELKAAVKNAKSKRSYFAYIQKSASDGTLLVGKSKIPDKEITAAKKKNGGSTTLKGACFGEGERFVFEMGKEPQDKEKLEDALNKVVKRDGGTSIAALCRRGNSPDLLDDNKPNEDNPYGVAIPVPEDTTQTSGTSPEVDNPYGTPIPVDKQGTAKPKVDNPYGTPIPVAQSASAKQPNDGNERVKSEPDKGDLYYQKRKPLEGRLADGLKQRRGDSPKLRQVFAYAEGAANKKEYDKGIQGLDALDKMLSKPSPPAPQIGDQRRLYFQRRKPLEPKLVAFLKAKHPEGERVATTFKVAEHRAKEEDFPVAMQALDRVEQLLRSSGSAPVVEQYANDPNYTITDLDHTGSVGQEPPGGEYNITDPDHIGTAEQQQVPQQVSLNPELDALLDQNMNPTQLAAELALKVDGIDTDWANGIDLTNASVDFPSNPKSGSFGMLGFIETGDPNTPKLVIKVPLKEAGAVELQHEVDMYKKVGEHPNIAKCMGVVQVDGHRGLVMEAVDGDNMTETMSKIQDAYKNGNISHEEFWGIQQFMMRETLRGLAQLEQAGVVHNDVRSDNIVVDKNTGDVKIIDFGVAVESGQHVEKFPRHTGTTSPDIVSSTGNTDAPVTPKHDEFAVGSMAYKAGEGQNFDYNQPGVHFRENRVAAFAAFAPEDQVAIRPGDANNPASIPDSELTHTKQPGRSGAETAYTKFVNKMMDPDPTKRMSPAEALNDPFLADSPIDDEAARKLISNLMTTGSNPDRKTTPGVIPQRNPQPVQQGAPPQDNAHDSTYNLTDGDMPGAQPPTAPHGNQPPQSQGVGVGNQAEEVEHYN